MKRRDHPVAWGPLGVALIVLVLSAACAEDDGGPDLGSGWTEPQLLTNSVDLLDLDGAANYALSVARDGSVAFSIWPSPAQQGGTMATVGSWEPRSGWSPRPGTVASEPSNEVAIAAGTGGRGTALWLGSAGILDQVSQRGVVTKEVGPTFAVDQAYIDRYPFRQARDYNRSGQIVLHGNGNASAIWLAGDSLWLATRPAGGRWSPREAVATQERTAAFGTDLFNPRLAVDGSGRLVVAWLKGIYPQGLGPVTGEIVVRRRESTGAWNPPQTVGLTYSSRDEPNVGMDDAGNAIVLWSISDGVEGSLWAARFEPGRGWGTAERLGIDPGPGAWRPRLAVGREGTATAVWGVYDRTRRRIKAVRYEPGRGWGTLEDIGTTEGDERAPVLAPGAAGTFAAVWVQQMLTRTRLWSNRFEGGAWGTPERVPNDEGAGAMHPLVGLDDRGNTLVVWSEGLAGERSLWGTRREATP